MKSKKKNFYKGGRTVAFLCLALQVVHQPLRAHVHVGQHELELGRGEDRAQLVPDRLPPVAAQVEQMVEQPVVLH